MPYYSAWNNIGAGMNNMAGTLAGALMQKKMLELQNAQFATNAALRAEQLGLQERQLGLQERQVEDTLGEAKETRGRAATGSRALLLQDMLRNPVLGQQQTTLNPAVELLRKEGMVPEDRFEIDRNSLGNALASLARSRIMETAVSTPQTAMMALRPPEVSPGATLANPLNPWEALMTAPDRMGAAARPTVIPRGGIMVTPDGQIVENPWTAQELPLSPNAWFGFMGRKEAAYKDLTPLEQALNYMIMEDEIRKRAWGNTPPSAGTGGRSLVPGTGTEPPASPSSQPLVDGAFYPMSDGTVRQFLGNDAQGNPKWGEPIVSR